MFNIFNTWKVLQCSAGEGWRRPVGAIVREMKKYYRIKEERNILRTIKRRKANWIGHILHSKCLLNHVTEGKIERRTEVIERRGGRRKQLLEYLKGIREYWNLKEEALARAGQRTRFGRGYGLVARRTAEGRSHLSVGVIVL